MILAPWGSVVISVGGGVLVARKGGVGSKEGSGSDKGGYFRGPCAGNQERKALRGCWLLELGGATPNVLTPPSGIPTCKLIPMGTNRA